MQVCFVLLRSLMHLWLCDGKAYKQLLEQGKAFVEVVRKVCSFVLCCYTPV